MGCTENKVNPHCDYNDATGQAVPLGTESSFHFKSALRFSHCCSPKASTSCGSFSVKFS